MVSVVNGSVITLFYVENVRSGYIIVAQIGIGGLVYFHLKISLSVGCVWVITAQ